jgi:hypothetical protein
VAYKSKSKVSPPRPPGAASRTTCLPACLPRRRRTVLAFWLALMHHAKDTAYTNHKTRDCQPVLCTLSVSLTTARRSLPCNFCARAAALREGRVLGVVDAVPRSCTEVWRGVLVWCSRTVSRC